MCCGLHGSADIRCSSQRYVFCRFQHFKIDIEVRGALFNRSHHFYFGVLLAISTTIQQIAELERDETASHLMTPKTFRRIALSLPEATEGSHFSNADFRIAGKIFATLALEHQGFGVLLLTPDQQASMIEDAPEIFSPVPGGWGEKGATRVTLKKVPADILEAALRVAWRRKAPKRLLP
jgi:hypothetical protein